MGEEKREAMRVDFDWRIRLEFHGAKVTSDTNPIRYHTEAEL